MTLASELEMRPLVAHCHAGLGRLYRAQEHLSTAAAMSGEMGMTYWLHAFDQKHAAPGRPQPERL